MRALSILIFSTLLYWNSLNAQSWDWVKTMSGWVDITAEAIAVDSDGNCYVTGDYNGNLIHGPTVMNQVPSDSYIAKYDSNGNSGWAIGAGSPFGGSIIPSYVTKDIEYNPATNHLYITGQTHTWWYCEVYHWGAVSYDTAGNYLASVSSASAPQAESYINDIDVNSAGKSVITGYRTDDLPNSSCLDTANNHRGYFNYQVFNPFPGSNHWIFNYSSNSQPVLKGYGVAIAPPPENSHYVIGNFNDSSIFINAPFSWFDSTHSSIVKYDGLGDFTWHRLLESTSSSQVKARSVATSAQGDVFVLGTTTGNITFESTTIPLNSNWGNGVFLMRINSNGDLIWGKTFPYQGGFSSLNKLVVDDHGNAYIAGTLNGNLKPKSNLTLNSANYSAPMIIFSIDSMGNYRFHEQIYGGAIPTSIKLSPDQNSLYVTGEMVYLVDTLSFQGLSGPITIMDSMNFHQSVFTGKLRGINRAVNDECGQAIQLTQHPYCMSIQGSTFTGTESLPADSCNGILGYSDDDVWYSFEALSADPVIEVSSSLNMVIELWDSCGGVRLDCANQFLGGSAAETIQSSGLIFGQEYYIRVYTADSSRGKFDICVYGNTNNNNPCNAIALPQDGTPLTGLYNNFATVDSNEQVLTPLLGSCNSDSSWCMGDVTGIQKSVWFSFIGPDSGKVEISTCGSGTNFNTQLSVYSVIDCNDFNTYTLFSANDDGDSCANGEAFLSLYCLTPGEIYYVMVDGFDGDSGYFDISMTPFPDVINLAASNTPAACVYDSSGVINLLINGGEGPYTYLWSTGDTTKDLHNYPPGTYSVMVTDICGNNRQGSFVIDSMSIPLIFSLSSTNSTCPLIPDGSINLSVVQGDAPYTYSWSNGATTQNLNNLDTGTYTVFMTDVCGNTDTASATVSVVNSLQIVGMLNPSTCALNPNGSIVLSLVNGIGPYTYSWSTGDTTQSLLGLGSGTYTVQVTDACGHTQTSSFAVTTVNSLQASLNAIPDTCPSSASGSTNLNISGGMAPYQYLWSNGATTQNLNGVPAGTYSVIATDACGNTWSDSAEIVSLNPLQISGITTSQTCLANPDGTIDLSISYGTPPYLVNWSNGDTGTNVSGLVSGSYFASITDACGNNKIKVYNVGSQAVPLTLSASVTDNDCGNSLNGIILITPSGGLGAYSFLWSTGDTTSQISGQPVGVYTLELSDSCGNTKIDTFTINAINTVEDASFSYSNTVVNQYASDIIPVITGTSGGTFSSNSSNLIINANTGEIDLCTSLPGNYTISYLTPGPCPDKEDVFLSINPASSLGITISEVSPDCPDDINGSIQIQTAGGRGPYHFLWANGDTTSFQNNLSQGMYMLSVFDDCGVQIDTSLIIEAVYTNDTALFVYDSTQFCLGETNPAAVILGTTGGTFSSDSSGLIFANSAIGEIDLQQSQAGTYEVIYITSGNCPDTSMLTLVLETCNTGLTNSLSKGGLLLYPNPTGGKVWLTASGNNAEEVEVIVYNVAGQKIINRPSERIDKEIMMEFDLSTFAEGIYLFEIFDKVNEQRYYHKILKR